VNGGRIKHRQKTPSIAKSSSSQPNSPHQILKPGIASNRVVGGIDLDRVEATRMFGVGLFQPDHRLVVVAHADVGDSEGQRIEWPMLP
jgi:hypothetical protein